MTGLLLGVLVVGVAYLSQLKVDIKNLPTKTISQLSPHLQEWFHAGQTAVVNGHNMFYKVVEPEPKCGCQSTANLILVHGFPTSSFDYQRSLKHLVSDCRCLTIVMFDHLGFGFSDKPPEV